MSHNQCQQADGCRFHSWYYCNSSSIILPSILYFVYLNTSVHHDQYKKNGLRFTTAHQHRRFFSFFSYISPRIQAWWQRRRRGGILHMQILFGLINPHPHCMSSVPNFVVPPDFSDRRLAVPQSEQSGNTITSPRICTWELYIILQSHVRFETSRQYFVIASFDQEQFSASNNAEKSMYWSTRIGIADQ